MSRTARLPSIGHEQQAFFLQDVFLRLNDLGDPDIGQFEEGVELIAGKGRPFGRSLDFEELTAVGFDDVHIGFSPGVLDVIQVAQGFPVDEADGNRPDEMAERQDARGISHPGAFSGPRPRQCRRR